MLKTATLEIGALFVVAFPVAAGAFYPYVINPAVAAIAMSGS